MRALIVEDSDYLVENLSGLLRDLGVRVVGSVTGEKAACDWLDANSGACDVVFVDVFLESGSGLGVLEHTRALAVPRRIVLTNHATEDIRARCQELGVTHVFDKTKELHRLLAWVSKSIDGG